MKDERVNKIENRPSRADTRAERAERVPINGIKNILNVTGIRPDFHPCWVNEDKVPQYVDAGYTFVDNDVSFGSYHVNQANPLGARYVRNVGLGTLAYLMEIKKEYYEADRAAEEAERLSSEASMVAEARSAGLDHGDLNLFRSRERSK